MITGISALFASITIAVLLFFAGREPHRTENATEVYVYPTALRRTVALVIPIPGVLGYVIYSTWPIAQKPTWMGVMILVTLFGTATLLCVAAFVNARLYRVELNETAIVIQKWLSRRRIPLPEIIDIDVVDGRGAIGGTKRLVLYLQEGTKVVVPGALTDFVDLSDSLSMKISSGRFGNFPSEMKRIDRERASADKAGENLITYIGIALVVLALIVVWEIK